LNRFLDVLRGDFIALGGRFWQDDDKGNPDC